MADISIIYEIRDYLVAGKELPARLKETPEHQQMHDKHILRNYVTIDQSTSEPINKDLIDLNRFNEFYGNQK